MNSPIEHRGPDAGGVWVGQGVGFAHRRLSIIDLSSGQQPMHTEDGRYAITFNGEIFNYLELKAELEKKGQRFRTASDTEVILAAFREWGEACVCRFNGDFAFALFDNETGHVFAARDRMGVRPFFYTQAHGCLVFGSEIKALLAFPGVEAKPDPFAIDQIFTFWFPLAPRTGFEGISELPPAHVLTFKGGKISTRAYWTLDFPRAQDAYDNRSEQAIVGDVRGVLEDATRLRLRSDVPVGAYLSGGLDSSIITALVKSIQPHNLHTFSVTFDTAEFDETDFQNQMVKALGTHHRSVPITPHQIGELFPAVIDVTERPIVRTAPAPLFKLSQFVHAQGYKVVLTGEGADEVFAGYDIFKEMSVRRFMARQPQSQIRPQLLRKLYPYLPRLSAQNPAYLEAFFGSRLDEVHDPLFSHLPRFRTTAAAKVFYSAAFREQLGGYDALDALRSGLPSEFMHWHTLNQAQYLETAYLLPGYILSSQGDRMAMAHGVEGRFPFLDHRVVEMAARIPVALKMRGLREKHVLREAFAPMLPHTIAQRVKQPYRAPDAPSFVGEGAPPWVAERVAPCALEETGFFNEGAVGKLMAKCAKGRPLGFKDNTALVGILSTQLWHKQFMRNT